MTRGEREDLHRLIRQREKVLKSAAAQRSAELLADFEQQMASIYHYNQDEVWRRAHAAATEAATEAVRLIAERCRELGIPDEFAPTLSLYWQGRGAGAVVQRQAELRRTAKARIAAIEKAACVRIEMISVEMQTEIASHGLTSAAARAFFDTLPKVEELMPPLELRQIEGMLDSLRLQHRLGEV
jgi:hypothetical protein